MLEFKQPELSDKPWVDSCLAHANSMNCEYSFGNLFCWKDSYSVQIAHYKDFFICRWGTAQDISYSVPLGEGDFTDAVNQIINDALKLGESPLYTALPKAIFLCSRRLFSENSNMNMTTV